MKDKKGFTLVELLAVVAILAILVILALPNIMELFNRSKKNSFTTEVKELYKIAEQTWMNESMNSTSDIVYARVHNGECGKLLDLTGRVILEYYIKINKAGKIVQFYATDGTYQYSYNGSGLRIEEINNVEPTTSSHALQKLQELCGFSGGTSNTPRVADQTPGVLDGEGTRANPYKIESMEDLVAFSQNINKKRYRSSNMVQEIVDGAYIYYYLYFTLETDLDFKSEYSYVNPEDTSLGDINKDGVTQGIMQEVNSGKGFPMISDTNDSSYGAAFDGKNHTIKNYNHKIIETDASKTIETSFWGYASDLLYLANINFEDVDIDIDTRGSANISVVLLHAKSINTYNIRNISVSGNINAKCDNACNVAGVLGSIGGQSTTSRVVNNVSASINIDVKGKSVNAGGITSGIYNYGYVANDCHYKGNINIEATNSAYVAGIAGNAMRFIGANNSVIGNINVKAKNAFVYGIAEASSGEMVDNISQNGIIFNSFYKGNINVDANSINYLGGLGKTKVNNSYFIGSIKQKVVDRPYSSFTAMIAPSGPVNNSYAIGDVEYIETSTPTSTSSSAIVGLLSGYDVVTNSFVRGTLKTTQVLTDRTHVGYLSGNKRGNPLIPPLSNGYYTPDTTYISSSNLTLTDNGEIVSINNLKQASWYTNTLLFGNEWETKNGYYPLVKKCNYNVNGYICTPTNELVSNQEWLKVEN